MSELRDLIIKKKGDEWCVYSKDGKKELGCHATEQGAKDQLAAIEIQKQKSARSLTMRVDAAQIRTATFEGKEHLVVPVVALMEGVIHAVNAETPELVLAEELKNCFAGFNGRPVVAGHPDDGVTQISANDPEVLEKEAFGMIFNAKVEDKKLKAEAWLDPRKASKNERAQNVIDRIKKNEMVEVSVGVFTATENKSGTFEGKEFVGIWRGIVPDHLAMLSEGTEGACSVDMGCGAPRAAQKEGNMAEGKTPLEKAEESSEERIRSATVMRNGQEDAQSDIELREMLHSALQMVEPGFLGVDAVFPSENLVVYSVAPGEQLMIMRRSFSVSEEDQEVKLKDDQEEVRPVTRFEPIKAAESTKEDEEPMDEKLKARLEALIANERSPYTPCDLEILAQFPEERIAALEAACEPPPEPEPAPVVPVENPMEDFEKEVGVSVAEAKTIIKAAQKAEADKKADLVSKLKAAQDAYSEEELNGMDITGLEKLTKLIGTPVPDGTVPDPPKINFGGKGAPNRTAEDNKVPVAPNLFERVREARKN